jgi:hypothetical protein
MIREMMTKQNPSQAATQGQDFRLPGATPGRLLSSFRLHPLTFISHPSSFVLQLSSFIVHPSSFRLQLSNMRRALSSFSLYHLPFTIYPLSFIPHPSPFNLQTSSFKLLRTAFCLLLTAYCLLPTVLNAQGCAMCYNSASAAHAGAKEALANGVLILLVPPMVFFALITVVVYIYRNKFRETPEWVPKHDRELQELLADIPPAKGTQPIGRSGDREIG